MAYCNDHKQMCGASLVLREFRDLICCSIRLTKEFAFCTQRFMTKPDIF